MMKNQANPDGGWRLLDHTADIRLEVWGTSLEKLFIYAAKSLSTLLTSPTEPNSEEQIQVALEGGELDELLVNWLREILFFTQTRRIVVTEADIVELSETSLKAKLKVRKKRIGAETSVEVKGVTYHGISIRVNDQGYTAQIIVDI
jgi:SHS2 domain-containing protein